MGPVKVAKLRSDRSTSVLSRHIASLLLIVNEWKMRMMVSQIDRVSEVCDQSCDRLSKNDHKLVYLKYNTMRTF